MRTALRWNRPCKSMINNALRTQKNACRRLCSGDNEFQAHHMTATAADMAGNGPAGRYFFLPGSTGRAREIAESFDNLEVRPSARGHDVYLGTLPSLSRDGEPIQVGSVSSGMGCPSLDIIVTELVMLGARRILRVGSSGSVQPKSVRVGSVVIGSGGVRDEGASRNYAPLEFPAVASQLMMTALIEGAHQLEAELQDPVFVGLIHSKDSLMAREFGYGPTTQRDVHHTYMKTLGELGVLASEMEASHLFTLGSVHSSAPAQNILEPVTDEDAGKTVMTGAVLGIIGDDEPFAQPEGVKRAIDNAVKVGLQGIRQLAFMEQNGIRH